MSLINPQVSHASNTNDTTLVVPSRMEGCRQMRRNNQRKCRAHKKQRVSINIEKLEQLKSINVFYCALRNLLKQKNLPQSIKAAGLRGLIVNLYGELFRSGLEPESNSTSFRQRQLEFIQTHFHPQVVFESTSFAQGIGFLIAQLDLCTALHHPKQPAGRRIEVEKIDAQGFIFRAHGHIQIRITRDAIRAFYPHKFGDQQFLAQVQDRTITCSWTQVFYFDEMNRIRYLVYEVDFLRGWSTLLKNPVELAHVMQFRNMNYSYARKTTLDEFEFTTALQSNIS